EGVIERQAGDLGARRADIDEGVGEVEVVEQVNALATTGRNLALAARLAAEGGCMGRVVRAAGEGLGDFRFGAVEELALEEHGYSPKSSSCRRSSVVRFAPGQAKMRQAKRGARRRWGTDYPTPWPERDPEASNRDRSSSLSPGVHAHTAV